MPDYKIYPPIGIARVGNAPDKFYIGPETYRGLPTNPDGNPFTQDDFRDGSYVSPGCALSYLSR